MTIGTRYAPVAKANDRHDLYRWEQNGQQWACCSPTHDLACQRCVQVDDLNATMMDQVEAGLVQMMDYVAATGLPKRGWVSWLTDAGLRRVEELMVRDVEAYVLLSVAAMGMAQQKRTHVELYHPDVSRGN